MPLNLNFFGSSTEQPNKIGGVLVQPQYIVSPSLSWIRSTVNINVHVHEGRKQQSYMTWRIAIADRKPLLPNTRKREVFGMSLSHEIVNFYIHMQQSVMIYNMVTCHDDQQDTFDVKVYKC